jgi:predicted transcriptional regulator
MPARNASAMRLAALATGFGVPAGDFSGRIAEVHARAAIAVVEGEWVTLVAPELGCVPCGITIDAPAGLSLRTLLVADAKVAARAGVLRVADAAFAIDLRGARQWRSGLTALRLDFGRASVCQACHTSWSALDADGRSRRLHRTADATLDCLVGATRRRDTAAAERAMSRIVGLGEGRTPAGDDYLVGYFAALWACNEPSKSFAAALATRLSELAADTEHVSRLYLEAAAVGEVSERIAAVAAGIAAGSDDAAIGSVIGAALAVGHSSGAAAVLGLLQGIAACCEPPLILAPMLS